METATVVENREETIAIVEESNIVVTETTQENSKRKNEQEYTEEENPVKIQKIDTEAVNKCSIVEAKTATESEEHNDPVNTCKSVSEEPSVVEKSCSHLVARFACIFAESGKPEASKKGLVLVRFKDRVQFRYFVANDCDNLKDFLDEPRILPYNWYIDNDFEVYHDDGYGAIDDNVTPVHLDFTDATIGPGVTSEWNYIRYLKGLVTHQLKFTHEELEKLPEYDHQLNFPHGELEKLPEEEGETVSK